MLIVAIALASARRSAQARRRAGEARCVRVAETAAKNSEVRRRGRRAVRGLRDDSTMMR